MEQRAQIPVGLPHERPTPSYWQQSPADIADFQSPNFLSSADVVIIGSGITGASVAWGLLAGHENQSIVMLEARETCSGATGRNGGHTKSGSYRSFLSNKEKYGVRTAVQIAHFEAANIQSLHKFAEDNNIACEIRPSLTIDVVYDEHEWTESKRAVEAMREAMPNDLAADYVLHPPKLVQSRFSCGGGTDPESTIFGGIEYAAGRMSAYLFVIGIIKMCLEKGLNLQTHTPVSRVSRIEGAKGEHGWKVETPAGVIQAKRVVLATNGYTAFLHKKFQGVLVPVRGQMAAQRPGTRLRTKPLATTYSFVYPGGFDYMIPRSTSSDQSREWDIIIGGGLGLARMGGMDEIGVTDDSILNPEISTHLRGSLVKYFGTNWGEDDSRGRLVQEWSGIMGFTADQHPFVGEVPEEKGLWVCAGFHGHGMVLAWLCAKALVAMMTDRDGADLREWFPDVFRVNEARFSEVFAGI